MLKKERIPLIDFSYELIKDQIIKNKKTADMQSELPGIQQKDLFIFFLVKKSAFIFLFKTFYSPTYFRTLIHHFILRSN